MQCVFVCVCMLVCLSVCLHARVKQRGRVCVRDVCVVRAKSRMWLYERVV